MKPGEHQFQRKMILLVEDETVVAMDEAGMLQSHGFDVVVVSSGEEAIARARDREVSLILMDIDLGRGKMDGTEAARAILEKRELPIVFLTGHREREMVERVKGITRYGYVLKSSGEFVLLESINMAYELFEACRKTQLEIEVRRSAEDALRENEERLRKAFESELVGFAISRQRDGTYLEVNQGFQTITGYERDELVGRTSRDLGFFTPAQRDQLVSELQTQGRLHNQELTFPAKGGKLRTILFSISPIQIRHEDCLLATVVDITGRKQVEEDLREARLMQEQIVKGARVGLWDWDLETDKVRYSPEWKAQIGYADDEIGDDLEELSSRIHPDDKKGLFEEVKRTLEHARTNHEAEFRMRHRDGSYRWILAQGSVLTDEEGNARRMVGSHIDITNLKNVETALKNSEQRFRTILKHDPNAVAVYDKDLRYIIASDRYIKDYGIEGGEIVGKHHYEVFPEMPRRWKDIHRRVLRGEILWNDNDSFVREDGSTTYNRWECRPWYTADGEIGGMITYSEVTTQRVQAEKQKDLLMQELNHRVNNDLALVDSLIRLKDRELGPRIDLSDLRSRIDSIRAIHRILHRSRDISRVELRSYCQRILINAFALCERKINVENSIPDLSLPTKTALILGLIVNELATNAVKHGFTQEREARFAIDLCIDKDKREYALTVSSTGRPFPDDVELENPSTLGLRLISGLVSQLEGRIDLRRQPFPTFSILFPDPDR